MPLPIVTYPHKVLRRPARRINPGDGNDPHELYREMLEAMDTAGGVGLAAPQVGKGLRFLIAQNTESGETHGLVNPQIISQSSAKQMGSEGCLSFPELFADIERSVEVTVRFQDLEFNEREKTFKGHFARVLQHEIDHLNGVLIIDRALDGLYRWVEEGTEDDEIVMTKEPVSSGTYEGR